MADRYALLRQATHAALFSGRGTVAADVLLAVAQGAPPACLADLVRKIRAHAYQVTDRDLDALRGQYSEDQLFEIIVAAAHGAASERLDAARRALEQA